MKRLILVFLLVPTMLHAQQAFKFDSLKVFDGADTVRIACKSSLIYFPKGFTLIANDSRVYTYLLPGSEFHNTQYLAFYDTGSLLEDTTSFNPVVIYQNKFKNTQVAQYIVNGNIALRKRNNTGIIFY